MQPADCRFYLLFTPELCTTAPWDCLAAAIDGGVDIVQWRVKSPDRAGHDRCRRICRARGVPLIVNDDVMLAVRTNGNGAHVGQEDMPADAARKLLGRRWLGVSTHDENQIAAAAAAGADYIGFGPCHPTTTKGYTNGKSPAEIEAAVATATKHALPLFAIGGIDAANLPALRLLGIDRIAVSRAILGDEDPRRAAAALRRWL